MMDVIHLKDIEQIRRGIAHTAVKTMNIALSEVSTGETNPSGQNEPETAKKCVQHCKSYVDSPVNET